jgi:hypothetical protein
VQQREVGRVDVSSVGVSKLACQQGHSS